MRPRSHDQLSFGDGFLDPDLFRLDDELTKVDELLSRREFLRPFEAVFDPTLGRPGTAVDVYLRMMFLKFRWGLSYEEVETEVRERLPWRYFCHLNLADPVPDATTLIKLNQRFGEERIRVLNKQLVGHLVKTKQLRPRKIRIDSTTLEANIIYPTDTGLIDQVVRVLTRSAKRLGQKITSHTRATKRALARLGASVRTKGKKEQRAHAMKTLKRVTALARETLRESEQALAHLAKRSPKNVTTGRAKLQDRFAGQVTLARQILHQTEQKLAGVKKVENRIISFFDPEARAIRKGKLAKPNEFGRTLDLNQDSSGVILDYVLRLGRAGDATRLLPLVERHRSAFGCVPEEVAADKGYYSAVNVQALTERGVKRVGIPKLGRLSREEKRHQRKRWFRLLYRFRSAIEAGISMLKRCFSLGRVLARGTSGTAVWTGWAILSFNLWQRT